MSISFQEAQNLALKAVNGIDAVEIIDIDEALDRVLAEDIICIKDLPAYNNSAMDGYAFKYQNRDSKLKVVATILAGDIQKEILNKNECYKIMTGAKVPNDVDTIVQKEFCKIDGDYIKIEKEIKKANAIRLKGEEQKKGNILLKKGEVLNPAKIALLASQGIAKIKVFKKIKIAICSSGNELKEPWEEASEDEVYNINGINIKMFLKKYGFKAEYLGSIPDNLETASDFIANLKDYDLIITTGGVSGGDADFTKRAFINNGLEVLFHGIKVKPGHPTLMGIMDKTFVMAMPGNPLAAIIHIMLLSMPVILKMQGAKRYFYNTLIVKNKAELKLKANRVNIVLGNLDNGEFIAYKNNKYGSGMITPLVESKYIALFGENIEKVEEGEEIKVIEIYSYLDSSENNYINY